MKSKLRILSALFANAMLLGLFAYRTRVFGPINHIQNPDTSAVGAQADTTSETSRSVSEIARGSSDPASNVGDASSPARATHECATIAENSATALSQVVQSLTDVVGYFKLSNQGVRGDLARASG